MPDSTNDSTKFHDVVNDWVKTISLDRKDYNYWKLMKSPRSMPPVIGRTPERRSHRWWKVMFRVGTRVHDRIARLVKQECFDSYICGDFYWNRADWDWLETVTGKLAESRSKPIYDPNWKPKPIKWGWTEPEGGDDE